MCSTARTRKVHPLFFLGMGLLTLGNVTRFLFQRSHLASEGSADAITGALFGAAIGVLLMAIVRRNRMP